MHIVVYQCQRYNFWKQITTKRSCHIFIYCCLSMSKIQFLKANHNFAHYGHVSLFVVYQCQRYNFWKQITTILSKFRTIIQLFINVKDTIFESKSQLKINSGIANGCCLSMSKIQFLKANHNPLILDFRVGQVVYQCQRYNFWKQITTIGNPILCPLRCLSMSKIQFLKANHNQHRDLIKLDYVVYQCQRYNFWKQITTWWW